MVCTGSSAADSRAKLLSKHPHDQGRQGARDKCGFQLCRATSMSKSGKSSSGINNQGLGALWYPSVKGLQICSFFQAHIG